jgi:hypothetical protein
MRSTKLVLRPLWVATIAAFGCSSSGINDQGADSFRFPRVVPVTGVVTIDGKPLSRAVVTFVPDHGGPGVGETDSEGKFRLKSYGSQDGVPPGEYKVAVSYLLSAEGEPQGLGPRSAMVQSPGMLSATERLPKNYSDPGRTELAATVGNGGGTFNFNLKGPLLEPPKSPSKKETPTDKENQKRDEEKPEPAALKKR